MNKTVRSGSQALFFLLVVLLLMLHTRLHAESFFDEDPDASFVHEGEVWEEQGVVIPAYPNKENLLPFNVANSQFKYFLDSISISVGADEVTRYSVVAVSVTGVRNVFYEGIRCDGREYKTYAYGVGAGPFRKMDSDWRPISVSGSQRFRSDLVSEYFCRDDSAPEKVRDIVQKLKYSF